MPDFGVPDDLEKLHFSVETTLGTCRSLMPAENTVSFGWRPCVMMRRLGRDDWTFTQTMQTYFFWCFFCRYWYSHIICVFQQKQMIQDACSFFCAWSMTLVNKRCKKSRLQATWKPMQLIHVEWIDNGFDRLPAHWLCCVSRDDKHVALENGLRVFMWAVFRHKISEKDTIGTNITISNCCCQRSGTCANISSKICGSGGDVQHVDKGWEYTMPLSFKMCYSHSQWLYNSCYIILS